MKILLVQETDWFEKGPYEQNHLMEKLSLMSHEVCVIDHEILWRKHRKEGLRAQKKIFNKVSQIYKDAMVTIIRPGIIRIPYLDYLSLLVSRWNEINQQIKKFKPDIIIGLHVLSAYLGMRAARKMGIPFLYYWIDTYHTLIPFKPFQAVGKLIEGRTLLSTDKIAVLDEKLQEVVLQMGAKPEKTCLVRCGVDLERFGPAVDGSAVLERHDIRKGDIVLCFIGSLSRFFDLEKVAIQLKEVKEDRLRLIIVGEGDAYNNLQEIRQKYNLQDKLILTGRKPYQQVPEYIAASDICLSPANPRTKIMQDIVPIKVYEYMASAKPVISVKIPGVIKEFGYNNGIVYVDNPEDMVGKAIELVENGNLGELGSKARQFAEKCSWDSITDKFEEILEMMIEEKRDRRKHDSYV